ncbi:DUF2057 domain-containing protein [Marinomonas sp. A79]|uniref:DUF2057 domain-containing protein n=1 Tax=Marinomonas vulgaris TaxID=2823372 RepID=A0ABS5H6R6_9GAMM|nr:DUF2057 domain-containing protein [Marinomonas vulgaris]MBR7887393.1 DUF2057 domain-containing protein [Marinomonas vulgaris]
MKVKNRFVAWSALCASVLAMPAVAATFDVPRSYEIMYVDLESSRQFGNDFKVDVDAGEHQIVVRFNKLLRIGDDTQEFQSEPVVLNLQFEENTSLTLKAPYIANKRQAEANAQKPEFTILDNTTGKAVNYQQQALEAQSGFQNTRDYREEVAKLAALAPDPVKAGPVPAPALTTDDVALDMLKFWYNQSDSATRKALRIWMENKSSEPDMSNIQFEMGQFWFQKADNDAKKAFRIWLVE